MVKKRNGRLAVMFSADEQKRYTALKLKTSFYDKARRVVLDWIEQKEIELSVKNK